MFSYYVPAHKSDGGDHFRVDWSDVTITVYCACAQEFAVGGAKMGDRGMPNTEDTPPGPLQQRLFEELSENNCPFLFGQTAGDPANCRVHSANIYFGILHGGSNIAK